MSKRRKKRPGLQTVKDAMKAADAADLPDGAWWSYVHDMSKADEGDINDLIEAAADELEKEGYYK